MEIWQVLGVVLLCGAVGGVLAAIFSEDRGFALPTKVKEATGSVYRPGFLGLIVIGAVAAGVSWSLYGPLADQPIFGGADDNPDDGDYRITGSAIGGAVLVGLGGSKWLASHVDKVLLKQAATSAASGQPNQEKSDEIKSAGPAEALRIARTL